MCAVLNIQRRLSIIAATLPFTVITKASAFELLQDDFTINMVKIYCCTNFTLVLLEFAAEIRSFDIVHIVVVG